MSENIQVQSPINFPLPELSEREQDRLFQAWSRYDLERYLLRWKSSPVSGPPGAFWDFSWRACDIGCGAGRYVIDQSLLNVDRAFLGIDKGTRRSSILRARTSELNRPNLFALHANATPVLAKFPDASLDAITIFYPNPWWPTKHRKKRWSYHPLFPRLIQTLKPGGMLTLCSNEAFYLSEWLFALNHHHEAQCLNVDVPGIAQTGRERTHFETQFLNSGIVCGEVVAVKEDR